MFSKFCYSGCMEGSWLDNIPSVERQKIRSRMSTEAYERLREKVKGPEDLEKEMKRSAEFAEMQFELQADPEVREKAREVVFRAMQEEGMETVVDMAHITPEIKKSLEQGAFSVAVSHHPHTHEEQVVAVPEGNIQEKIPFKQAMSDRLMSQALQGSWAKKARSSREKST